MTADAPVRALECRKAERLHPTHKERAGWNISYIQIAHFQRHIGPIACKDAFCSGNDLAFGTLGVDLDEARRSTRSLHVSVQCRARYVRLGRHERLAGGSIEARREGGIK